MKTEYLIVLLALAFGCGSNANKEIDSVSGVYVREQTVNITDIETGKGIGLRTIRDTIFIKPLKGEFEVINHKWAMNDYDNEGWRNMQHSEDRPRPKYRAKYNDESRTLFGEDITLYFERENESVFFVRGKEYDRITTGQDSKKN